MNVDEHSVGIDIRDLQVRSFTDSKSQGVNDLETGPVMRKMDTIENSVDFLSAQDHREYLFLWRPDKFKRSPFFFGNFEGNIIKIPYIEIKSITYIGNSISLIIKMKNRSFINLINKSYK